MQMMFNLLLGKSQVFRAMFVDLAFTGMVARSIRLKRTTLNSFSRTLRTSQLVDAFVCQIVIKFHGQCLHKSFSFKLFRCGEFYSLIVALLY